MKTWALLAMLITATTLHADDAKLAALFRDYLDSEFRMRPLNATRLGDHRFDDQLDDVSPIARARWTLAVGKALSDLSRLDPKKLSPAGQVDLAIWRGDLERSLWLIDNTSPFEDDPRVYNELVTDSIYLLFTQSTEPLATNLRNAAQRMARIPRVLDTARECLKNPPRVIVETAIKQNRGAIQFYEQGLFELIGHDRRTSDLGPIARTVVSSLKEYQKFLEDDLLPRAKGDWRLGKAKFTKKMEYELNAGISADQVLSAAEMDLHRLHDEMFVIARQLWPTLFPGKRLPPYDAKGKAATIHEVLDAVSQEHGKAEDLVKDAQAGVEKIKDFIREQKLLKLPEPDRCKIIEMPEFQRGNSVAYLNPAPPLDAKASSYYAISPPPSEWDAERKASYLREYNRHMLQILTIHEAYPGHFVQLEYANRHPSLIRKILASGVYVEGWAVYTEQMMLDEGYGAGDLKLRLNQLKWYLRTVCNAILDYNMHAGTWTDQQALDFLIKMGFQSEAEAILKVIRAKQSSCQLSTYFVGQLGFRTLRLNLQRELGAAFDLGTFHEACLEQGSVPMKHLPDLVRERLRGTTPR